MWRKGILLFKKKNRTLSIICLLIVLKKLSNNDLKPKYNPTPNLYPSPSPHPLYISRKNNNDNNKIILLIMCTYLYIVLTLEKMYWSNLLHSKCFYNLYVVLYFVRVVFYKNKYRNALSFVKVVFNKNNWFNAHVSRGKINHK